MPDGVTYICCTCTMCNFDLDQKKYGLSTKKILEATKSKPELAQDIKNWDRKINSLNEILKKYEE